MYSTFELRSEDAAGGLARYSPLVNISSHPSSIWEMGRLLAKVREIEGDGGVGMMIRAGLIERALGSIEARNVSILIN